MAAVTAANLSAAYKKLYINQKLETMVFDQVSRPFLSRVKKNPNFQGDKYPMPVMYDDVGGGSNTFTVAQANVAAMALATFELDVKHYYRIQQVETLALRKARSNLGSFLSKEKIKTDSMLNALANDIEKSLFGSSIGNLGVVGGSVAGNTLTLAAAGSMKYVQKGDKLVAAANATSSIRTGVATVTAVDYLAGTATVTMSTASTLTHGDWTVGDLVWRQGDYVTASDRLHLSGLQNWIPTSVASSGDSHFGVDRFPNRQKLAGYYMSTGSLSNIEHSILMGATALADMNGAAPDTFFCSYTLWGLLAKEKQIEVRRKPGEGKLGFESFYVTGPKSHIEIVPATFCQPAMTGWLLTMADWELISAGPAVALWDDDGNLAMRIYNADAIEIRASSYPQLGCYRPARNCRIDFS